MRTTTFCLNRAQQNAFYQIRFDLTSNALRGMPATAKRKPGTSAFVNPDDFKSVPDTQRVPRPAFPRDFGRHDVLVEGGSHISPCQMLVLQASASAQANRTLFSHGRRPVRA